MKLWRTTPVVPRRQSWRRLCSLVSLLLYLTPAHAHRLDEYLQATILTLEKDRLHAQLTLTPGTAILPTVFSELDTDKDGRISPVEEQAYAKRVLTDLSLKLNGRPLTPQLRNLQFPTIDDMQQGRGEIQLDLIADLPSGPSTRNLTFENFHQPEISVYQVNTLVSSDPNIRIAKQDRNYTQSRYQLDYEQDSPVPPIAKRAAWLLATAAILRLAWQVFTSQRQRLTAVQTGHPTPS